ncbi:MAG: hypothetical protein ACREK5_03700 [Gemmatimonadota bacterium]
MVVDLGGRWPPGKYELATGTDVPLDAQALDLTVQPGPSLARADQGQVGARGETPRPGEAQRVDPDPKPPSDDAGGRAGRQAARPDDEPGPATPRAAPRTAAPDSVAAHPRPSEPQRGVPSPAEAMGRLVPPRVKLPPPAAAKPSAPTVSEALGPAGGGVAEVPAAAVALVAAKLSFATPVVDQGPVPGGTEITLYQPQLKAWLIWSSLAAQGFEWRWQVSLWPFPTTASLSPPGLLQDSTVSSGNFWIDLASFPPLGQAPAKNLVVSQGGVPNQVGVPPPAAGGEGQAVQDIQQLPVSQPPLSPKASGDLSQTLTADQEPGPLPDVPIDFYIRLIPTKNSQPAGPPSNVVIAHYVPGPDPFVEATNKALNEGLHPPFPFAVMKVDVEIPPAPNPDLASCVRIVSETPPFPKGIGLGVHVNPDGSTVAKGSGGTKITGALPYTLQNGVALYPFTACPGERANFQWGSVGCGYDPFCYAGEFFGDVGEAAIEAGEFLVGLANGVADAYNELKAWAIDQVASVVCPGEVGAECKTLINVGVDILLTSVGVPPTMPSFDDLANAAKGELVDLALDQLGVGAACDAVATAGTGKSCGELASQLHKLDACTLAPKGHEDQCRNLLEDAEAACKLATNSDECVALTTDAQDLVKAGFAEVYDQSVAAIDQQVTQASMEALGFFALAPTAQNHYCQWGGPAGDQVICPKDTYVKVAFGSGGSVPGCSLGTFGQDQGKVVCSYPPRHSVAIPEPLGQRQPIKVDVWLAQNDKPVSKSLSCESISAVVTTVTPKGSVGQPYMPATAATGKALFSTDLHKVTLWLDKPKPGAESLLEGGSSVGVKVSGQCLPEAYPGAGSQVLFEGGIGQIPLPKPRIPPGSP